MFTRKNLSIVKNFVNNLAMIMIGLTFSIVAGVVFSTSSPGLEAAHAQDSTPQTRGIQDVLVVPSDESGRQSVYVSGDEYTFLATGKETNEQFALFDFVVPPGGGPPQHIHYTESESFYVLEGNLTVQQGEQSVVATPGTYVYLPKDRPHSFRNLGTTTARMLSLVVPAGLEETFTEAGQPVTDKSAPIPSPTTEGLARLEEVSHEGRSRGEIVLPGMQLPSTQGLPDYLLVPPDVPGRESVSIAGNHYSSLATHKETGGEYSLFNISIAPQARSGLLQSNDQEANSFYILDGDLLLKVGEKTIHATPGTFVYLPEGTPYAYKNLGTMPVKTLFFNVAPVP